MADPDERAARVKGLLDTLEDGRAKLFLTWQGLRSRATRPLLFEKGDYVALAAVGVKSEHICAFARVFDGETLITIAPRWFATLLAAREDKPLGGAIWGDTTIAVPPECDGLAFENLLTGECLYANNTTALGPHLAVRETLGHFPVGLLLSVAAEIANPAVSEAVGLS